MVGQILSELCEAFSVTKSRTTPYHPMGDGLVERMNRSILNLLRDLVDREEDWEEHLQLLLYKKHVSNFLPWSECSHRGGPTSVNT